MRSRLSQVPVTFIVVLLSLVCLQSPTFTTVARADGADPIVTFNTQSLKFHHPNCAHARQCTVNCINIPRSEALRRGGVPCKHCGGGMWKVSSRTPESPGRAADDRALLTGH
jgi:hypothetical protein